MDLVRAREPYAADARLIWIACEQGHCAGFVAAIGVTSIWYKGMVLDWLVALDSFSSLPAVGLGDYVAGCDRHTSRRTVKLI